MDFFVKDIKSNSEIIKNISQTFAESGQEQNKIKLYRQKLHSILGKIKKRLDSIRHYLLNSNRAPEHAEKSLQAIHLTMDLQYEVDGIRNRFSLSNFEQGTDSLPMNYLEDIRHFNEACDAYIRDIEQIRFK